MWSLCIQSAHTVVLALFSLIVFMNRTFQVLVFHAGTHLSSVLSPFFLFFVVVWNESQVLLTFVDSAVAGKGYYGVVSCVCCAVLTSVFRNPSALRKSVWILSSFSIFRKFSHLFFRLLYFTFCCILLLSVVYLLSSSLLILMRCSYFVCEVYSW